jgi:TIR domain
MNEDTNSPVVFVSYAHEDAKWRELLVKHLTATEQPVWTDEAIPYGDDWLPKIITALEKAKVIICLVSVDFLCSDFIKKVEVRLALKKRETGEVLILPVIIRECDWKNTWLSPIKHRPQDRDALPGNPKSVRVEKEFKEIAQQVAKFIGTPPATSETQIKPEDRASTPDASRKASGTPSGVRREPTEQKSIATGGEKTQLSGGLASGKPDQNEGQY